jgi:hypothetical protein
MVKEGRCQSQVTNVMMDCAVSLPGEPTALKMVRLQTRVLGDLG